MKVLPWDSDRKFIITSSPDYTEENFWEMIWENNVKVIVMLCSAGRKEYFPIEKGESCIHGNFTIKNASITSRKSSNERILKVSKEGTEESRSVNHLHFLEWPDLGVPESVDSIGEFMKLVHKRAKEINSTDPELVIHCGAGVGRSGTFLTAYGGYSHFVDLPKDHGLTPKALDFTETVIGFRKQRHPWMVEGKEQYKMAYDTILYLLKKMFS